MARGGDAVDALVGRNIRILRQERGVSQTELARKVGVTFQQVQKYENGTNRVGAGRLFKIASVFKVPISVLFEGADEALPEENPASSVALLAEPYVLRTARALAAVRDEAFRNRSRNSPSTWRTGRPLDVARAAGSRARWGLVGRDASGAVV